MVQDLKNLYFYLITI